MTWEITYRRGDKGTCCGWARAPCSLVRGEAGMATAGAGAAATLTGRAASSWKLKPLRRPARADLNGCGEIGDGRLSVGRRSMCGRGILGTARGHQWRRRRAGRKVGGRRRDEENIGWDPDTSCFGGTAQAFWAENKISIIPSKRLPRRLEHL